MQGDLSDYRKSYDKGKLLEQQMTKNPIEQFEKWFLEIVANFSEIEANAMTVSTIGLDGFPKGRVVLLKRFSTEGFVFFTNYGSDKGKAILHNPNICLSFFWQGAERQVIIKGKAEKVDANESDAYFSSRPKGSQLGALASHQSNVIDGRNGLEHKLQELEEQYGNKDIPRPDYWGGYLVKPVEVEFWQGRANRLHDRIRFTLVENDQWKMERLSP